MAAPALIQSAGGTQGKGKTITCTLGAAPSSGNLLVFAFGIAANTTDPSSVLGGSGKSYTSGIALTFDTNSRCQIWVRRSDGTEDAAQVATWVPNIVGVGFCLEFDDGGGSGWETSANVVKDTASNDSSGTSMTVPTVGGTADSILHVAGFFQRNNSFYSSPTNSYTLQGSNNQGSDLTGGYTWKAYSSPPSTDEGTGLTSSQSSNYGSIHVELARITVAGGQEILTLRAEGY